MTTSFRPMGLNDLKGRTGAKSVVAPLSRDRDLIGSNSDRTQPTSISSASSSAPAHAIVGRPTSGKAERCGRGSAGRGTNEHAYMNGAGTGTGKIEMQNEEQEEESMDKAMSLAIERMVDERVDERIASITASLRATVDTLESRAQQSARVLCNKKASSTLAIQSRHTVPTVTPGASHATHVSLFAADPRPTPQPAGYGGGG